MVNSNQTYFPKTQRIRNEIIGLGSQDVKKLYNSKNLKELINRTFNAEYSQYVKEEQYFPGCPFKIYQKHYTIRLEAYLFKRPDADEFNFLLIEDATISRILEMNFYKFFSGLYYDPHKDNFNLSAKKTRDFIDNRIHELGHYFYVPNFDDPCDIPEGLPREYWKPQRNPDAPVNLNTVNESDGNFPKPNNLISKQSNSEITSTQWALYHYVLQKCKIKPWFIEKKKEFIVLGEEYGKHWNNLQTRWNLINNTEGLGGYTENDAIAVETLISINYPKALPAFKEIRNKLLN